MILVFFVCTDFIYIRDENHVLRNELILKDYLDNIIKMRSREYRKDI